MPMALRGTPMITAYMGYTSNQPPMLKASTDSRTDDPSKTPKRVTNWAAIAGRWTFDGDSCLFTGPTSQESNPANAVAPVGIALGAPTFRDGIVRTRVTLSRNSKTTAGILLGFASTKAPHIIVQIGAYDRAYAVTEYRPDVGFFALDSAGSIENIEPEVEHELSVKLQGQNLSLTVDSVNVLNVLLRQPLSAQGLGLFVWGDAKVVFRETEIQDSSPKVFVIMPFAEPFDTLYRDVIEPVAHDQLGFEILRVDEIQAPGIIIEDIQRQITSCHAVVAEISTRNPNVFYELGYAHALNKPAILLVRREDSGDIPFDLKPYRAIYYDDSIGGKKSVMRNLSAHLEAIKRGVLKEILV
jgi:hypothetical protein